MTLLFCKHVRKDTTNAMEAIDVKEAILGLCTDTSCKSYALVTKREGLMICPHCARPMEWKYVTMGDAFTGDPRAGKVLDVILARAVAAERGE